MTILGSKNRGFVILTGFYVVIFFSIGVVVHEQTHAFIYEDYGCNTSINYIDFDRPEAFASTEATCPVHEMSEAELQGMRTSQKTVDAVGYQIMPMYVILVLILSGITIVYTRQETRKI